VLSGKDGEGRYLRDHGHAFYLPTAEGTERRWITHITVVAAQGFGISEVAAMRALRTLRVSGDSPDLRVQLIGVGRPLDFRAPLLEHSTTLLSATPFIVTRYPKLRGRKRDRPEDYATPWAFARRVLEEELCRKCTAQPVEIRHEEFVGPNNLRPIQFKRFRNKPGDDGGRRPAGGFRLTFAQPVQGPLCLGYSCHFGLGLFLPTSSSPSGPRDEGS
jgi:CRISPR-associated protein Csb2